MVYRIASERKKTAVRPPVRTRPFGSGQKKAADDREVLGVKRHAKPPKGKTLDTKNISEESSNDKMDFQLPKKSVHNFVKTISEEVEQDNTCSKGLEIVEKMEFTSGRNKLTIRFCKKPNRMYRLQIFLNDELEIRPVTYNGWSLAKGYWTLLKGTLKK